MGSLLSGLKSVSFKIAGIEYALHDDYNAKIDLLPGSVEGNNLKVNEFINVINQVEKYKPDIFFWGQEPFLYKYLMSFIAYLSNKRMNTFVSTTGILIDSFVEELVNRKVTGLVISPDSPESLIGSIKDKTLSYEIIIKNLKLLRDYKLSSKKVFPMVELHFIVNKNNYNNLYQFISAVNEDNLCRRILVQLPMIFTRDMCSKFSHHVEAIFGESRKRSWEKFEECYSNVEMCTLNEQITKVITKYKNVVIFPENTDALLWLGNPQQMPNKKCLAQQRRLNIEPSGNVVACMDFPETVYGNILFESIEEVFHNSIITRHRNVLNEGIPGICPRCSSLYLYDK